MLTELLLVAGACFLGKKALDNPDKAKEVMKKCGDSLAHEAMKSGNAECQEAAEKYYAARRRDEETPACLSLRDEDS